MDVADSPQSATAQIMQETTVTYRQEKAIEKAAIVYPDVYASAGDKDNPYKKWIQGTMSTLHKIEKSYAWAGARKQVEFSELDLDQILTVMIDYNDGYENLSRRGQKLIKTIRS